jgi:drug/metabolite transporter (DMT)-like permease
LLKYKEKRKEAMNNSHDTRPNGENVTSKTDVSLTLIEKPSSFNEAISSDQVESFLKNDEKDVQDGTAGETLLIDPKTSSKKDYDEKEIKTSSIERRILVSDFFQAIRGFLCALGSAFFVSLSKTLIKKSPLFSGSDQTFIRYVIQGLIMITIVKYNSLNYLGPKGTRKLLCLRGLTGSLGILFIYFSVTFIAPSDTISITLSSVIITSLLARFFLGEKLSIAHLIAIVLTISGAMLITQPSFIFGSEAKNSSTTKTSVSYNAIMNNKLNESINCTQLVTVAQKINADEQLIALMKNQSHLVNTSNCIQVILNDQGQTFESNKQPSILIKQNSYSFAIGIFFAFCAAFTTAIVYTTVKKLNQVQVHFSLSIIYGSYFGLPLAFATSLVLYFASPSHIMSFSFVKENYALLVRQLAFSVLSALCGTTSQIFLNFALKYEDASKIAIMRTTDLLFAFALQYILLRIEKDMANAAGCLLILLGTFIVLSYKIVNKRLETNEKNKSNKKSGWAKRLLLVKF